MRVAISGASGTIGRELAGRLGERGHELVLIGRSPDALRRDNPGATALSLDEWASDNRPIDAFVHLAVLNSDAEATSEQYQQVNVELTASFYDDAVSRQARLFVLAGSLQEPRPGATYGYAASKREGEERVLARSAVPTAIVRLPYVHGARHRGRWSVLNRLPDVVAKLSFTVLQTVLPTVSMSRATEAFRRVVEEQITGELIVADPLAERPVYRGVSRVIDIAGAVACVALLWPVALVTAVAVRAESHGPAVFAQRRLGRSGQPFTCYKFRTMRLGTVQAGTHQVSQASVTRVGRFLRRWKLDELPQAINVLTGSMSFVGPRPCLPSQTELIAARDRLGVLDMRPGITGWSQVHGIDMSDPVRLARSDAEANARRTLLFDLKMMVWTLTGRGFGDRVRIDARQPVAIAPNSSE